MFFAFFTGSFSDVPASLSLDGNLNGCTGEYMFFFSEYDQLEPTEQQTWQTASC